MNDDAAEWLLRGLMSGEPDAPVGLAEVLAQLRPAWMARAHCRGLPTELFFPNAEDDSDEWREVCAGCPVQAECLAHAMGSRRTAGIWAGTSPYERNQLRQRGSAA